MPEEGKTRPPEWAEGAAEDGFASFVMPGVGSRHDGMPGGGTFIPKPSRKLDVDDYVDGVKKRDRSILARAITLVESNKPEHTRIAQEVLQRLLPYTGRSVRLGITGVPGAGKSTFIEALGTMLCGMGRSVAVLAVDPSSTVTKGSILGDKTRMEQLSRQPNAFIRPSPSGGTLGGVARKSRETLLLCEAAGYDIILVETVGVGQSEVTVRSMADCFLLVVLTGAGDELQGMKKGVLELADIITVNKADGDNKQKALLTRADYERILHYLRPSTPGWNTPAMTCSAVTGEGIKDVWLNVEKFINRIKESGYFEERRKRQEIEWMYQVLQEQLTQMFFSNPAVAGQKAAIEKAVSEGALLTTNAVRKLLELYGGKY